MAGNVKRSGLSAFNGKEFDVAPVIPANLIITRKLRDKIGYFFPEAHYNAELNLSNTTVDVMVR